MQGYTKDSVGPFILVHCNGKVVVSMEGYSKGSVGTFIPLQYNGLV
jgi:hypothetical protein